MTVKRNDLVKWIGEPVICAGVNVKPGDLLTVVNEVPGKVSGDILLKQTNGISFFADPKEVEDADFL